MLILFSNPSLQKHHTENQKVISRKIAVVNDMLFVSGVFMERVQRYKSMIMNSLKVSSFLI